MNPPHEVVLLIHYRTFSSEHYTSETGPIAETALYYLYWVNYALGDHVQVYLMIAGIVACPRIFKIS